MKRFLKVLLVLVIIAEILTEQDRSDEGCILRREVLVLRIAVQQQVMRAVLHFDGSLTLDLLRETLQHTAATGEIESRYTVLHFLEFLPNRRQDLLQLEFDSLCQLLRRDHEVTTEFR